jgi:hypothetical protein
VRQMQASQHGATHQNCAPKSRSAVEPMSLTFHLQTD